MSRIAESPADHADTPPPCPPRPRVASELGFVRRPMVRWFDPHQLVDTAVRVLLSGMFSAYADSRESQAREPAEVPDHSAPADLWLDYVADLGDGWNSTYTVASLLAAEALELACDGETHRTERGRILVMGATPSTPCPRRPSTRTGCWARTGRRSRARPGNRPSCSPSRAATTGTTAWSTSPASSVAIAGSADGGRASAAATSRSSFPTAGGCGASTSSSGRPSTRSSCSTSPMSPPTGCSPATVSSCACPRRSTAAATRARSTPTAMWSTSNARSSRPAAPSSCSTSSASIAVLYRAVHY